MPRYSLRDGKITANKISISGKLMVTDIFSNVAASNTVMVASVVATSANSAVTASTQPDYARGLKIENAFQAAYTGTRDFMFAGYDAKGQYITEAVTCYGGVASVARTNNAFLYVGSIYPLAQKDADEWGTFAVKFTDRLGLSHPITTQLDIKSLIRFQGTSAWGLKHVGTTNNNLLGSATNKYIHVTYDTIETGAAADNCTGSTMIIRYLTEFQ